MRVRHKFAEVSVGWMSQGDVQDIEGRCGNISDAGRTVIGRL